MKRSKTISGLTRLEYLCYIAIFGILAFLTVPSLVFMKKVCASKNTIGKSIVSSVIRAQQAYYEKYGRFMTSPEQVNKYWSEDWSEESKYLKAQNQLWDISIQTKSNITFVYAVAKEKTVYINGFYSYVGAVTYDKSKNQSLRIICRATKPGTVQLTEPILQPGRNMRLICPLGTDDC